MPSDIDATAWGADGERLGMLSTSTRAAVAEWASGLDAVQVLLAKGSKRERWTRPATDAPWKQAGRWEHSEATSPADEVGRASGRPVDTRPQTGAQAAHGGVA